MNNKVTIEDVQANMKDVIVRTVVEFGKPCTYVTVRMLNGFTVRESTTCVDPANYDENIGKQICLEKIQDKIWLLLGYELQSKLNALPASPYCHVKEGDGIGFVYGGKVYSVGNDGKVSVAKAENITYIENMTADQTKRITNEGQLEVGKTYCAFSNVDSDLNIIFKVIDATLFGKEVMAIDEAKGVYTNPAFSVDALANYNIFLVTPDK